MFSRLSLALLLSVALLLPAAVLAQKYPTKPIRLIIPFAPGGTNDILGRMVAQHLTETWGETVIPDNRPGFQGIIGTNLAAKADPDGYTLIVLSAGYTMNAATLKTPYDTATAFEFAARIGESFLILAVGPKLPDVRSVKDLLATAQRRPGEIVFTTSGGFMNFATQLFQSVTKQKYNIVVYKGGYPAMIDVIGGQGDAHLAVSLPALPFLRSGQLKGLGVALKERSELFPDLPTLAEAGVEGYEAANWYAIAAPAHTPRAIVMKLHDEIARFFKSPEMLKKMTAMGVVVDIKTSEEMRKIIPAEVAKWTKVATDAGMPRGDP